MPRDTTKDMPDLSRKTDESLLENDLELVPPSNAFFQMLSPEVEKTALWNVFPLHTDR